MTGRDLMRLYRLLVLAGVGRFESPVSVPWLALDLSV